MVGVNGINIQCCGLNARPDAKSNLLAKGRVDNTVLFSGTADEPEATPKPKRKRGLVQNVGIGIAFIGMLISLGMGAKANVDYDGKFNLIPVNAEEEHQQKKAGIPGILVLGAGTLISALGRRRRT